MMPGLLQQLKRDLVSHKKTIGNISLKVRTILSFMQSPLTDPDKGISRSKHKPLSAFNFVLRNQHNNLYSKKLSPCLTEMKKD